MKDYGFEIRTYERDTARPPQNFSRHGIMKAAIRFWTPVVVFFHNPGTFETARQLTNLKISTGQKFYVDLEHEVFNMLDFGGEECIDSKKNKEYNKDICTHEALEKRTIDM